MKKQIEKYIPNALNAVRTILAQVDDKGVASVYEEYDGYAASFGASVLTSGLLPTLSFYSDVHKKDQKNNVPTARRYRILIALAAILKEEGLAYSKTDRTALLDFAITKKDDRAALKQLKQRILAASAALKLALRNFKHVKSPSDNES